MKRFLCMLLLMLGVLSNDSLLAQKSKILYQDISFPGGQENLQLFFKENIHLPSKVMIEGIEGYVEVETQFDENGKVQNAKVISTFDSDYNEEALRLIRSMPNWEPFIKRYKPQPITIKVAVPFYAERNKSFHFNRAKYYDSQNKYHEAYLALDVAVFTDSMNYEVHKFMAEVLLKLGQPKNACHYLNKAVSLGCEDCQSMKNIHCASFSALELNTKVKGNELDSVDQIANFAATVGDLMLFVSKNVRYPAYERENNLEGRVYVSFLITADGELRDPYIIQSFSPGASQEVLRVVSTFPKFRPAIRKNKKVPMRMTAPVNFKLR